MFENLKSIVQEIKISKIQSQRRQKYLTSKIQISIAKIPRPVFVSFTCQDL